MNNYHQGLRALDGGELERAIACFTRALAIDPADRDAHAERGFAYLLAGDVAAAGGDCDAALRIDGAHGRTRHLSARLHAEHGELAEALEDFETAIAADPYDARLWRDRAELYRRLGNLAAVESDLEHAEALDPSTPAAGKHTRRPSQTPPPASAATPEPAAVEEFAIGKDAATAEAVAAADVAVSPAPSEKVPWGAGLWAVVRGGLASAVVHASVLVTLAMLVVRAQQHSTAPELLVDTAAQNAEFEGAAMVASPESKQRTGAFVPIGNTSRSQELPSLAPAELRAPIERKSTGLMNLALLDEGTRFGKRGDLLNEVDWAEKSPLAALRSDEGRQAAVVERGGTPESEAAVQKALAWLAKHQNYDGSWNFDHRFSGDCRAACRNPGTHKDARIGATALALLPFLGAGHTPAVDGSKYQKQVQAGLRFLTRTMQKGNFDGAMVEPQARMYDHGLASIVLCEAYAMTQDRDLQKTAKRAVHFIVVAQDPIGGGWRYRPGMPGDTSVVAWYLMALKSAHMAYLPVPQETVTGASRFLDYVQQDEGSGYGYVDPSRGTQATSAAGLLCRMFLGMKREDPGLVRGVQLISSQGPSSTDMYYNYYATQVLHHYEGPLWKQWNDNMRDYLIRAQADKGHETGSWFFEDPHGALPGGRLYNTAMAAMTLEVYYRHMPLYTKRVDQDNLAP